jgi:competence protein ComGC
MEIMTVTVTIAGLAMIAIPNMIHARETAQQKSCVETLRRVRNAKEEFFIENHLPATHTPTLNELVGPDQYLKTTPQCPSGGAYSLGSGTEEPTCNHARHSLDQSGGS